MRRMPLLRHLRILVLLIPASVAYAQAPPPPLTPLPPPPQPPGNLVTAAKANLGKVLFWDEQVSSSRTVACGSCHRAGSGGSDPRARFASAHTTNPGVDGVLGTADDVLGSAGVVLGNADGSYAWSNVFGLQEQVTGRLAPSHINAAYAPNLFWDGRAGVTFNDPISGTTVLANGGALENQAVAPPVSSAEMGHLGRDWNDVAARVAVSLPLALATELPLALTTWIADRAYPALFEEAFGTSDVTPSRIALAIASYERTQFSTQAPFDSVIAGTAVLAPPEAAGMQLFGQLGCAGCHAGSLTSDNAFHYTGVRPAAEDSGRMIVTHNLADLGAFKTPSLRNVALRPAFMHDGRFRTLAEVVAFYNRGGDFNAPNKPPVIRPLGLNAQQQAQLVAFLSRPLTDVRVANAAAPFDRPTLYTESALVPRILFGGTPGASGIPPQPVALEPALSGNPAFTLGVYGALGGGAAVLVVDAVEPPTGAIPASGSFARVATTLQGSGANGGFGSVTLPIPTDPSLIGQTLYARWYVSDPSATGGVAASPTIVFQVFGAHGSGAGTVGMPTPAGVPYAARLYSGYPNPFSVHSSIRFDLLQPSRVRLDVFDLQGRLTRRLVDRPWAASGVYSQVWDGRDDAGRAVPAGVYFYRLETDRGAQTTRVVHIQ